MEKRIATALKRLKHMREQGNEIVWIYCSANDCLIDVINGNGKGASEIQYFTDSDEFDEDKSHKNDRFIFHVDSVIEKLLTDNLDLIISWLE